MTDTLSTNGRTRLQANRRDGQVWPALPGGCERSESDGASRPYLYRCFASPPTPVHPAPHSGSERRSPILNRRSRPGAQAASSSVVGSALLYAPERRAKKKRPRGRWSRNSWSRNSCPATGGKMRPAGYTKARDGRRFHYARTFSTARPSERDAGAEPRIDRRASLLGPPERAQHRSVAGNVIGQKPVDGWLVRPR